MLRISATLAVLVCLAVGVAPLERRSNDWLAYKAEHGKSYGSRVEDSMRHSIYLRNKQRIERFNAEESDVAGYKMGLNKLADWTEDEIGRTRFRANGEAYSRENSLEAAQFLSEILGNRSEPLPDAVDWRQVPGRVTPVRESGGACSSSQAFVTTGVLEGQELKATGRKELVELSVQNLLDCVPDGCMGMWPAQALQSIFERDGIESEANYPYIGYLRHCHYNASRSIMKTRGPVVLPEDEEILKIVVAKYGPVATLYSAPDSFTLYREGVFKSTECGKDVNSLNYALLVVGYGTDPKEGDYWLLKNYLGETWGENGYVRLARNQDNMCGIVTLATIAALYK